MLVVEDEEPLALLLQYNLEAEGYVVDVVHRGDEAEVSIAENSPDLILSLIHISEPTRLRLKSRMPSSA